MKTAEIYRYYIALITTGSFTFGLMFNQLTGLRFPVNISNATLLSILVSFMCIIKNVDSYYRRKKAQE